MPSLSKITTCLWFDNQAQEAADFYTSVFPNSKLTNSERYTEGGQEVHGQKPGSTMVVAFEIAGQHFVGLNGGPAAWSFNESISFQIGCEDQAEVDHFWEKLSEGGDPTKQRCGWVSDKFGVSWQVVPAALKDMLGSSDREAAGRATMEMMKMKKLDIAALQKAFKG